MHIYCRSFCESAAFSESAKRSRPWSPRRPPTRNSCRACTTFLVSSGPIIFVPRTYEEGDHQSLSKCVSSQNAPRLTTSNTITACSTRSCVQNNESCLRLSSLVSWRMTLPPSSCREKAREKHCQLKTRTNHKTYHIMLKGKVAKPLSPDIWKRLPHVIELIPP